MRETDQYYFFWKHQFGQWTLRNMTDPDGISYNCCEQYMMYKKAQLFSDSALADKILKEADPANLMFKLWYLDLRIYLRNVFCIKLLIYLP